MPRVGEVLGILFYVYADDHNPPHVHAKYGEKEMLVEIETGDVLAGSLPGSKQREALAWVESNRALVSQAWDRLNP